MYSRCVVWCKLTSTLPSELPTCHWVPPPQLPEERWTAGRACWNSAAVRPSDGPPPLPEPPGSRSHRGYTCGAGDSADPGPRYRQCCFLQNNWKFQWRTLNVKANRWAVVLIRDLSSEEENKQRLSLSGIVQNPQQAHLAWEIQMSGCDCYATPKCPHPQKGVLELTQRSQTVLIPVTAGLVADSPGHLEPEGSSCNLGSPK